MTDKQETRTAEELAEKLFVVMQHRHDIGADNGVALVECVELILEQGWREALQEMLDVGFLQHTPGCSSYPCGQHRCKCGLLELIEKENLRA